MLFGDNSPRKVPLVAFTCSTIPDPKTVNSITTQLRLGDETNARLHSGHLYQLFAYVVNREMSNEGGPVHEGILLYPTVGDETRIDFLTHGRRFQARSVDLGSDGESIHSTMLQVIDLE